jgi:hypothetical protein
VQLDGKVEVFGLQFEKETGDASQLGRTLRQAGIPRKFAEVIEIARIAFDKPLLLSCQLHPIVTVSIEPSELLTPFILGSEGSSLWSPTGIIGTRTLFISIPTSNN